MGTCGTIIWLDDSEGNCSYIREIHTDMAPDFKYGSVAVSVFKTVKTRDKFVARGLEMLVYSGYVRRDELTVDDLDWETWIRRANVITRNFHNVRGDDGIGTYYRNWNSDYLYVLNMTGSDVETKDFDGNPVKIENGFINVFNFGKFYGKIPIVDEDEIVEKRKESTMKKLADKYEPPIITLKDAVKEYEIKLTKDDLVVVESLENILTSGVEEVTLCYDKDKDRVTVQGQYKSVTCTNVKVKKISNKGNINSGISDTKVHIECSHWMFPCPDYKYSNIKRNLERAICSILGIGDCEVKSFNTSIVEFDGEDRK